MKISFKLFNYSAESMFFPLNVPFFEMYGVCNVDKVELEAFLHYFQ